MTQGEQIWNEAFKSVHIGKETQPPLVKYREAIEKVEALTQQQTINDNIITQYEIRVQQDAEKIALLKASLATTENQCKLSQKEESDTYRELVVLGLSSGIVKLT